MFEVEFIEEEALDIIEVPLAMRSEVSLQEAKHEINTGLLGFPRPHQQDDSLGRQTSDLPGSGVGVHDELYQTLADPEPRQVGRTGGGDGLGSIVDGRLVTGVGRAETGEVVVDVGDDGGVRVVKDCRDENRGRFMVNSIPHRGETGDETYWARGC